MGKESKLRNAKTESKYTYKNGDRKLYDRDAVPDGLDSDIWSLAIFFEDKAEKYGCLTPGRPIVYTELYNRISKDSDLVKLLRSGDVQYAGARDTGGSTGGMEDTTIISIIEEMIHFFFDSGIYDYDNHTLNDFVARINFDYIKRYVIDGRKFKIIKETSVFTEQEERQVKPSRKTEEEKEAYRIKNAPRTEELTKEKIEHWKRDNSQPS